MFWKVVLFLILILVLALLVFSPIDFVPDQIPVAGSIDDAGYGAAILALVQALRKLSKKVDAAATPPKDAGPQA